MLRSCGEVAKEKFVDEVQGRLLDETLGRFNPRAPKLVDLIKRAGEMPEETIGIAKEAARSLAEGNVADAMETLRKANMLKLIQGKKLVE